jgi:RNA polymerase sigma factor (sigma-70 family)
LTNRQGVPSTNHAQTYVLLVHDSPRPSDCQAARERACWEEVTEELKRCAAHPAELTRCLYEKYGERLFTFCFARLRNREEAQDAVQTTFIYVLRSLQRGVEPEFELAWLLKIAFNVCRSAQRSTSRISAATQVVEDIDELAAPAAAGYEGREQLDALREGLAHLPERQRRAILLREWQGFSYAEIADELRLTVGAVETLLFRARRSLTSRSASPAGKDFA